MTLAPPIHAMGDSGAIWPDQKMNINDITIGQLEKLAPYFNRNSGYSPEPNSSQPPRDLGQNICVLDRGFVYVGNVTEYHDRIVIDDAKNIRSWGTSKGLGELRNGPLTGTKLDSVGSASVYRHAVITLIPCKGF